MGLPRPNVEWFDCNSPIAAQVQQVPVQGDFEFEAVNLQTVHERSTSQPPSLSAPNALAALGGDDLRLILAELSRRTFLPSSLGAPTSEPKVRFDSTGDRGVKIVVSYTFQVTNLPEELR